MKRKAIASLGTGPHELLLHMAARSFAPFAARHGYDVHLHTEVVDASRPAPWSKIPILHELLGSYETVLWLDSDLVIVDPREDVPAPGFMALVEHPTMPNTGVWALRSGDATRAFLDEVWAQTDLLEHRWWENAAVCRVLGYDLDPVALRTPTAWHGQTTFLDPRWNVIRDAKVPRARIRHYPGYKPRTRAVFMARDLLVRRR